MPTLVVVGDEDDPCIAPALFLKSVIPACGVALFPQCGHAPNAEEPAKFNMQLAEFLSQVDGGRWVALEGHATDKFSASMVGRSEDPTSKRAKTKCHTWAGAYMRVWYSAHFFMTVIR